MGGTCWQQYQVAELWGKLSTERFPRFFFSPDPYILLKGAYRLFDLGIFFEFPFYFTARVYGGRVIFAAKGRAYFREREAAELSGHIHGYLSWERDVLVSFFALHIRELYIIE